MRDFRPMAELRFGVADYCVFLLMIAGSTLIGIYYGYWKKAPVEDEDVTITKVTGEIHFGSKAMEDYLLGSSKMAVFPIGMSLVGTYISAVTFLGTPPEMYNYGTQQWIVVLSILLSGIVVCIFFLPIFMHLRPDSSYEYLQMRFHPSMRFLTSLLFLVDEIFFLPIAVYCPCLALEQVTGIHFGVSSAVVCVCTVIYTIAGGMKAVVHTDAWQIYIMFFSCVLVMIIGTIEVGGFYNVWHETNEGGRWIFFNMDFSLYERYTFWTVLIGNFFYWTSFNAINQTMVQRYLALRTYRQACESIAIFTIAMMIFESLCYYCGVLIFTYYRFCDPGSAGYVEKDDQLFALFVMQTSEWLPGVPGIFMAGVFGASLSSMSVCMNSTALVIFEDLAKNMCHIHLSERASKILVKTSIAILGFYSWILTYVVHKMGPIFSVAIGTTAIANSTSFGIFALGMFVPWANWKGAAFGAICGFCVTSWSVFGSHILIHLGEINFPKLPLEVRDCPGNVTLKPMDYPDESHIFPFYRLSYLWINLTGTLAVVIPGVIFSVLTGRTKAKEVDAALFSPVIHRFLPDECFENSTMKRASKRSTVQ